MGQIIDPNSLLIKSDQQPATVAFFNNLIVQFCNAINGIGVRMDGYDAVENQLVTLGLANINNTLGPFLGTLQSAAQLGFLVAQADGISASLTLGAPFDLILTSSGAELFTPTTWLMALDVNDATNWGILALDSWIQADKNLATHCIYANKTQASTSWQVCCGSGVLNAMINDLAAANSAASNAAAANTAAQSAKDYCASVAGTISAGPVVSVAGKTGPVTLVEGDVANLVSDLAARPTTSYVNSALSGLQPHSANLDQLASAVITAFGLSLFGAANAAAAMGTLGAAPLLSPAFTGAPTAPTPTAGDNSTKLATTAFIAALLTTAAYAPLASPALTGTPTAPTPTAGDNSTKVATTAFVLANAPGLGKGPVRTSTSASITIASTDLGGLVMMNFSGINAAPTFVLPATSAAVPVGSWVRLGVLNCGFADGAGTPNYNVGVTGASGVTVWNGTVSGSAGGQTPPGYAQSFIMHATNAWNAAY